MLMSFLSFKYQELCTHYCKAFQSWLYHNHLENTLEEGKKKITSQGSTIK